MNDPASLETRFARLQDAARRDPCSARLERDRRLALLDRLLRDNADAIAEAVNCDFGHRAVAETRLLELFPSYEAIRHARRHLWRWMCPQRRKVSLWFQPGRAEIRYQPLGVVGIIVPWNYPVYLAVGPLVAALAAGNRVLIKMSEFTPATGHLLTSLIARYFDDDEVSVVEGGAEVAQAFARLPFDHLLFTGSTEVGRHVMRAAAENLTPVTLELGGKSPAIIGPALQGTAAFRKAVERIMVGKCLNAGQTCIAPDYVLLPAGQEQAFVDAAIHAVAACYPAISATPDFTSIVNERHFTRLSSYLEDAKAQGAEIVELAPGSAADAVSRRMPPVALFKVNDHMRVMQEEIFGPLLPVVVYHDLDQAIAYVNARPRPLALYYFDTDNARIQRVLDQTVSGGVTINDTLLHIAQDDLPFGGVGPSGMGCYHGLEGFKTFSVNKPVFHQSCLSGIGLFKAPYGVLFERLIRILLR